VAEGQLMAAQVVAADREAAAVATEVVLAGPVGEVIEGLMVGEIYLGCMRITHCNSRFSKLEKAVTISCSLLIART